MTVVLDSSAVLALLWGEVGGERVVNVLADARISAVNLGELVSKLVERGASDGEAAAVVNKLGVEVVAFDAEQAFAVGTMRRATKAAGLSIGDRACLALAARDGATALTTDRIWTKVAGSVDVEVIR